MRCLAILDQSLGFLRILASSWSIISCNASSKMATPSYFDTTKMASTSAALEGLPKQFVVAMKTLFEVMDDRKSGYVKLSG